MEFVKNQIARIQEQLGGLNATQRMLAGSLVTIMVLTLLWWSSFAGKAEMAMLLDQSMTPQDIDNATRYLDSRGIKYTVAGDKVQVPADRRYEILAGLEYAQLLPRDTKTAFDEVVSRTNIFTTTKQQEDMWNQAKQAELTQILRRMQGVRYAMVIIDVAKQRGFNAAEPSATVYLNMQSGQNPDGRLVNAAADLVSGAVANLPRQRVKVIIDGVSYPVHGNDSTSPAATGDEILALIVRNEERIREKLARHLHFIEGVQVDVSVKPDLERVEKVSHTIDPKASFYKPISEETNSDQTTSTEREASEPGVTPNVGISVGESAGGGGSNQTTEKANTQFHVDVATIDTKTSKPAGEVEITGVSVYVPRSHFVKVYQKITNSADRQPDTTVLDTFIATELASLKGGIKTNLGLMKDDLVHVGSYIDLMPVAMTMPQAASTSMSMLVSSHAKELGLGALALVSLFMAASMVRKSSPAPAVAAMPQAIKAPSLSLGEEAVGEAGETSPLLDGMELDEDAVKAQQMLNQVQTMVNDNPEAAASMVKRWLHRS